MKWFYEMIYSRFRAPWDVGPRVELVALVESGRISPGRAIDLGSGTASNCVYLAQQGFEVTGVDYAQAAAELGRQRAAEANAAVTFVVDDLTNLQHVSGIFDLLVDYGTLDDLLSAQRDQYMQNILPLAHPGSQFVLYCFEHAAPWWERVLMKMLPFGAIALEPGEVDARFGPYFSIELYSRGSTGMKWPSKEAVYLMIRKGETQ